MKLTRFEFIKLINYDQTGAETMARNTSSNREFHQAVINGEIYSGFRSREDADKLKENN